MDAVNKSGKFDTEFQGFTGKFCTCSIVTFFGVHTLTVSRIIFNWPLLQVPMVH
jgi:hypothetical protein